MLLINPTQSLYAGVEPEPCCPSCGRARCCSPGQCAGTRQPNPVLGLQLPAGQYDVRGFSAPAHCGRNYKGIQLSLRGVAGPVTACVFGPFSTYPDLYARALAILQFGDPELRVSQVLVGAPLGAITRSVATLWNRRAPYDSVGELLTSRDSGWVGALPIRVVNRPYRRKHRWRRNP